MINRLTIIGVGLIGGSLAKALRQANAVNEIVGCGLDGAQLQTAIELGVIDHFEMNVSEAIKNADVVVLAVPVGAMGSVFAQMKLGLTENMVITDVGSTKKHVISAAREVFGEVPAQFVPGHPIAGTEKTGVEASFAGLFHNRRIILTPLDITSRSAIETVRNMWQLTGAKVDIVSTEHHDHVLAATSHLPHILAFSLVDTLAKMNDKVKIFQFAAGGFRDFTRIASSDPKMWHDICVTNRDELLLVIQEFRNGLDQLTLAIEQEDSDSLLEIFSRAKHARDKFTEQST
ncbi:MAG: prephenate dehydrogenase [Thiohalomonadales bacterium]